MAENSRRKQNKYIYGSDTEAALRRKGSTVAQRKAGRIESSVRSSGDNRRRSENRSEDYDDSYENSGVINEKPSRARKSQTAAGSSEKKRNPAASGNSRSSGNTRTGEASGRTVRGTYPAGSRGRAAAGTETKNTAGRQTGRPAGSRNVGGNAGGSSERPGTGRAGRVGTGQKEAYRQYESEAEETSLADDITIISVLALSILMILSYFNLCGKVGVGVNIVVFGLFGRLGYILPVLIFCMTVFFIANKGKNTVSAGKIVFSFVFLCVLSALVQMATGGYDETLKVADYFTYSRIDIEQAFPAYGGLFGGILVFMLCPLLGSVGTVVTLIALALILFVLITGKAFITYLSRKVNRRAHEIRNNRRIERQERRIYEEEQDDTGMYQQNRPGGRRVRSLPRRRMGSFEVYDSPVSPAQDADAAVTSAEEEELKKSLDREQKRQENLSNLWKRPRSVSEYPSPAATKTDRKNAGTEEEKLHSIGENVKDQEKVSDESRFADSEIDTRFADKPPIDLINLRNNPNPVRKNTTKQYIVTDEDSNIVKVPVSKSLHAGSSNPEDTGNGIGYKIHGLYPEDKQEEIQEETAENGKTSADDKISSDDKNGAFTEGYPFGMTESEHKDDDRALVEDYMQESEPDDVSNITPIGLMQKKNSRGNADSGRSEDTSTKVTEVPKKSQGTMRDSSGAVRFTDVNAVQKPVEPVKHEYIFPPVSLLKKSRGETRDLAAKKLELEQTIEKLQHAFESFNVGVKVTEASVGPTVTRYEVLPDDGVKVKAITSLSDDIKLALAAPEIRIEAPIPGKAAVGIEVPNKESAPVLFGDMIDSEEFRSSKSKLSFAVGKDISGETVVSNIGGMPHALIAGATGSGKSVCINALIMSILYKAKPEEVKMIMIDPKRVELVGYNGIPHLLVPVVTDVKKANGALQWAILEMDNRYKLFADNAVTNLASYNELVEKKYREEGGTGDCPDKLPQILLIVDELNDLMMTANSKDVEAAICRLTQLARACGIHVILATQRPSVNVITGTIKANIPTRIAFSVSSLVDSRTIIDQSGAEKLLGKGDMLFYPQGYAKPVRLQGAYVSDGEVAEVVKFIKDQYKEFKYNDDVSRHIDEGAGGESSTAQNDPGGAQNADARDEYFVQAGRFIIEKQKSSIGMLQRVYKIGFNRAARIMDQLAEEGVVGPEDGTKARKILMTMEEFNEKYGE